jgi:predicted 3-demethylubiquinone-9 3-methyltransferase (glyoxalase superfamily)
VDTPSGPAGSVKIVDFTLFGQRFQAMSAGPLDPFNHAISMVVLCDDQAELDRYWTGLLEGGGKEEQCGWLRDRYGLAWQIVPRVMDEMMADKGRGPREAGGERDAADGEARHREAEGRVRRTLSAAQPPRRHGRTTIRSSTTPGQRQCAGCQAPCGP